MNGVLETTSYPSIAATLYIPVRSKVSLYRMITGMVSYSWWGSGSVIVVSIGGIGVIITTLSWGSGFGVGTGGTLGGGVDPQATRKISNRRFIIPFFDLSNNLSFL